MVPACGSVVWLRTIGRPVRARVFALPDDVAAGRRVALYFDDKQYHDAGRAFRTLYLSAFLAALIGVQGAQRG